MLNKYELLEEVITDLDFQSFTTDKFNILMNLLNISVAERLLLTQVTVPEIISNKDLLIRKLCAFLKDGLAIIIGEVMKMSENEIETI